MPHRALAQGYTRRTVVPRSVEDLADARKLGAAILAALVQVPMGENAARRALGVYSGRLDLRAFVTHRYTLDQIEEAYDLFADEADGVIEVAIRP